MKKIEKIIVAVNSWLISKLREGRIPWVRPWVDASIRSGGKRYPLTDLPSNICSPEYYYGPFNCIYLTQQMERRGQEFRSNFYITPKALGKLGVKMPKEDPFTIFRGFPSAYGLPQTIVRLYHVEQMENCAEVIGFSFGGREDHDFSNKKSKRALDNLIREHSLCVEEGKGYAAFRPATNLVFMPEVDQFIEKHGKEEGESHYWATMWHEVMHWTGHPDRLKRHTAGMSQKDLYALEELVAEIGAAYLCSYFGIKERERLQHPEYIKHWLSVLESDAQLPYQVLVDAQRAATWIVKNSSTRRRSI